MFKSFFNYKQTPELSVFVLVSVFICTCQCLKFDSRGSSYDTSLTVKGKTVAAKNIKVIQSSLSQNKNKQYSNKTTHVYTCVRYSYITASVFLVKPMRDSCVMSHCGAKERVGYKYLRKGRRNVSLSFISH